MNTDMKQAKQQLLEKAEDKPEEVRQTVMEMLLPAIKQLQNHGKKAEKEQKVYKAMKKHEGEPEKIRQVLKNWMDEREVENIDIDKVNK